MLRNIVIKIYIVKVKSNARGSCPRSEHEVFQKFRTVAMLPIYSFVTRSVSTRRRSLTAVVCDQSFTHSRRLLTFNCEKGIEKDM